MQFEKLTFLIRAFSLRHAKNLGQISGTLLAGVLCLLSPLYAADSQSEIQSLIDESCLHCHDSATQTRLDFEALSHEYSDADTFAMWERVFDRLSAEEMPPTSEPPLNPPQRAAVLATLEERLLSHNLQEQATAGRVRARRLTKLEYGYTIQDLLKIDLDVTSEIPDETSADSFDTVGASQRLSAIHLESYLRAADKALQEAIRLERNPQKTNRTNYAWLAEWHDKPLDQGGSVTRKLDNSEGIALFRDIDYLTGFQFAAFAGTAAPTGGVYRLTAELAAIQTDQPLTAKLIIKSPSGGARLALATDILPGDPQSISAEAYLWPGDTAYVTYEDPNSASGAIFTAGGARHYQGPGLAIHSQEVEGPLSESWPPPSTRLLLHGMELVEKPSLLGVLGGLFGQSKTDNAGFEAKPSLSPQEHVKAILDHVAPLALRRPLADAEVQAFAALAQPAIEQGQAMESAIRVPIRSLLASPQFLLFDEQPGELDDYAFANRLSYFLWKSMPDEELFSLADEQRLRQPAVLATQVERMLSDRKSRRFVDDFLGQWLRLHQVNVTTPDDGLYPEFDEILASAIPKETQLFFVELLNENLGIHNLIDSDFVIVNRRLAEHYGIPDVQGQEMRRVSLPAESPRGGVLTQAAILKTTANGTNTSPVMRGNFVLANFLGDPPPPPPPNVGSIEPDTRGQTTIREILAAHREIDTCNQCHREIDPPGFALESFDPIGGHRTHYRISGGEYSSGGFVTKLPPKQGPAVDPSGVTSDGKPFGNITEFKRLLKNHSDKVARNFIEKLVVYATGAEIQFADRQEIDAVFEELRSGDFGVRDIVHAVVQTRMFRHK